MNLYGGAVRELCPVGFQLGMLDRESANRLAEAAAELGYRVAAYENPECVCFGQQNAPREWSRPIDGVIAIRAERAGLGRRYAGHADDWGSLGNGQDPAPTDKNPVPKPVRDRLPGFRDRL